ncbi:MAG: dihydroorotase [Caldimicrobium sp.]|nr:dihydroorotase [Caldimicrobium sp.]MCX7613799.1 dihydroorotase [Caldimicrobium sp.]MDW8182626.1 dihydroorotase [Caldimicrobium sp.]
MVRLIKEGRILDPSLGLDLVGDLLIVDGTIRGVAPSIEYPEKVDTISARGCLVIPGIVDIHVHLREPGEEWKEDIESGTRAALHGGVLRVACMPNTKPPNDSPEVTSYILEKARERAHVKVYPIATITKGQSGKELTEFGRLKEAGVVALSDDGKWVSDASLMKKALLYAKNFDLPLISHCEEPNLSNRGQINEGILSAKLGLKGIPFSAETIAVVRDLLLLKETNSYLHLAHLSVKESIPFLRWAKEEGLSFTAETCPHYFTLTETEVDGYNTIAKVNPPLRTEEDVQAIKHALKEGLIEVIASDHAPHSPLEKEVEFELASFGMIGLQFLLPLSYDLVRQGFLSQQKLLEYLITNPARVIKVDPPNFREGSPAEVVIFNPEKDWVVTEECILSKSKNTPLLGRTIKGKVEAVILGEGVFRL